MDQTEATLAAGDIVALRSGGPAMTVMMTAVMTIDRSSTDNVQCIWMDRDGVRQAMFPVACLERRSATGS